MNLPNSITSIGYMTFNRCYALTSVIIPNSVKIIGEKAFKECSSLTSVTIGNSVTIIGNGAFQGCLQLPSVNIPQSVTSIGEYAFADIDMPTVVSLIKDPFPISGSVFSINTFNNATLYVPTGTVDKYKEINGWNSFLFMEEVSGDSNPTTNKCEKPTIRYSNGKLLFESAIEGALCQSTITDSDITSYSGNEVQLGVTYNISVYATATGYEDSDVATATLCWIDVEPKTEGIENSVSQVRAKAILIQTNNGTLSVTGVENGTDIAVYSSSGIMVGATNASGDSTSIATGLLNGEIAIVKIGDRAIKVVMK